MSMLNFALVKQYLFSKLGDSTQLWGGSTKTVLGYNNAIYKHIHNPSYILPNDCTTIDVTSSATANTFGDFVEIVSETDRAIDFHWANIVEVTELGVYIIELHEVDATDLQVSEKYLGSISVSRLDIFTKASQVSVQVPVMPTGKRIACRVKRGTAGAGTVKFNLTYHDYT